MIKWWIANIGTVCVSLVLAAIVAWIVWRLVSDKKKGKSSCGCQCAHCAMTGQCHKHS